MDKKSVLTRFSNGMAAVGLGVAALAVYCASLAPYAFPGESARLIALWRGLDVSAAAAHPLMAAFARLFGVGNGMAPVLGALAVMMVYLTTEAFLRMRLGREQAFGGAAARLGAVATALVFMLTPAVREAATHLEPRLFDFVWAMLVVFALLPVGRLPVGAGWAVSFAAGALAGLGLCDSPLFAAVLPLYVILLWSVSLRGGRSPWVPIVAFVFAFLLAFAVLAASVAGEFVPFARGLKADFLAYMSFEGWLFVLLFAALPFLVALVASRRSLRDNGGWTQWLFHTALTFVVILAVATPLSPSAQMAPFAILPVAPSAYAAFAAGYLVAYWCMKVAAGAAARKAAAAKGRPAADLSSYLGYAVGGLFAVVLLFTLILNAFDFDAGRGAFADKVAEKVLEDMGARTWLVTDGSLDNHLLLAAQRRGQEIHLVALDRESDASYIKRLTEEVREAYLGGDRNPELLLSLSLGVLPFVQDWFASDPSAREKAAVWGAADLWLRAGIESVPEFLFFGADPSRVPDWETDWKAFAEVLHAPEGWGSYRLARNRNPVERMRLDLRRHVGLIANNRGVWLEDKGRMPEAFAMFELVLNGIDADNVCALLNEYELANAGEKGAAAKVNQLKSRLEAIVADKSRRYRDIPLSVHYGYIRSPEMYARHGLSWARSGRPGEALLNFGRAIDLVPTDRRTSLMNMMAAVYASENEHGKSRALYEDILSRDAENHDALIGLMRLEMMEGNTERAIAYLERANNASGDDPRGHVERAMLHMMRGELPEAKALLRKATDADNANLQAWSFLAAVTIQQIDAAKDEKTRTALLKDLEDNILRTMEKQARDPSDYYVQTTRAFLLLRKGGERENRQGARDALIAAARDRPDITATGDMILGLDISLNDTTDAERHAREVLRRNRKAPLANYVMGSLALQRGEYAEAEAFLRRAADVPKPVVLALNDLSEVLRRSGKLDEAEVYARRAVKADPALYVAWDTLASIILARKGDLDEAERCVSKACELSKSADGRETDVRMLISLAKVQFAKGDVQRAKGTLRKVLKRADELSDFERAEFEELRKRGK